MAAEDFLINDGSDRQAIKAVGERLPKLDVVSPLACNTETSKEKNYDPRSMELGMAMSHSNFSSHHQYDP